MELRQLRYFAVLAEELHFGRAADRLHMSQPPLSVQLRKLEDELGVPLLDRSTRRVELTAAGLELQERLAQVLPMLDDALTGLDEVRAGMRGHVEIGFVSSASYTVLPAAVRMFRELRPHVEPRLSPLTTAEQIERVQEGQLDVAIVRDPSPSELYAVTPLVDERLVVCAPRDHALAAGGAGRVAPADVLEHPLIGYPRHLMPGFVDVVHAALAPTRRQLRYAHKVVHQETALGFVAAGEGVTVLPESVREQLPASIRAVELDTDARSRLVAVTAPGDAPSAAALAFRDCLLAAAAVTTAP